MDTSDILELGVITLLMAVMILLPFRHSVDYFNKVYENVEVVDKNSSNDYSTVITKADTAEHDLMDELIAISLGCDTDKLANLRLRIYVNKNITQDFLVGYAELPILASKMQYWIDDEINKGYSKIDYRNSIAFNESAVEVYIER